ncbi:MAG: NADH:ubiquinone oxidoreductase subunit NDUFA12 [Alphaproteobacteria bacterium CG_4_10_14_0_8_um_filter_37_21]|nr:MAG: NADH:ubiquinone oxidoreductase subunit NDUFA12 [Alphaproteobacteria bacterium CG_4_10_14_0_8_um_filter_37_21]
MTNLFFVLKSWFTREFVGQDAFGNKYYRHKHDARKRWVHYKGYNDATKIPPHWHSWIHHSAPIPLSENLAPHYTKMSYPNLTGTGFKHIPKNTTSASKKQAGYTAWKP